MKHILFLFLFAFASISVCAQVKVRQDGAMEGPFPMGKEGYPTLDGKVMKSATKIFVSTSGIDIEDFTVDPSGTLVRVDKVVGGYELWLNPANSKKAMPSIKAGNGDIITAPLTSNKSKLKSNKKYILNLTTEGKDVNEGCAYLIVKSTSNNKIEITGNSYNQTYDVKASDTKMIKLPYGTYNVVDKNGISHHVNLENKPVILKL